MRVGGNRHAPASLRPGKRPVILCTGGCGATGPFWASAVKFAPQLLSNSGPSSPQTAVIPNRLFRPVYSIVSKTVKKSNIRISKVKFNGVIKRNDFKFLVFCITTTTETKKYKSGIHMFRFPFH